MLLECLEAMSLLLIHLENKNGVLVYLLSAYKLCHSLLIHPKAHMVFSLWQKVSMYAKWFHYILSEFIGFTLGEKPRFSTMVLITFQLHFEVENVTSNCKMVFSTQNDVFNCLPKWLAMLSQTHNTVEAYLHVSNFQQTLIWQYFSWKWWTILVDKTFLTSKCRSSTLSKYQSWTFNYFPTSRIVIWGKLPLDELHPLTNHDVIKEWVLISITF
jgi:hypothetical protein